MYTVQNPKKKEKKMGVPHMNLSKFLNPVDKKKQQNNN